VTDSIDPALVEQLARLPSGRRRDALAMARAVRRRRIQAALRQIRAGLLSRHRDNGAARLIEDAVRNRHTDSDPAMRNAIRGALSQELGSIDDIPGAERIRQLIKN
jgi:hypothetical protein